MATYKVLQDIEAEDKLLGPLTLKQFIFAAIFACLGFLQFLILSSGAPLVLIAPFMALLLVPMLVFGFLAWPLGQDQPNDIWLLARLRFLFKPHRRIWNQDGMSQLVTITAPKRDTHVYTNNLSQLEIKSRLQALANTVDSRGWAIKNVDTNLFAEPSYLASIESDRLVSPVDLPQDVPAAVVTAADDILDENNPTAQHLNQLVEASAKERQTKVRATMHHDPSAAPTPQNYWFMNQDQPAAQTKMPNDFATFHSQQVVTPGGDDAIHAGQATDEEATLGSRLAKEHQQALAHISDRMKTVQPLHNPDGTIRKQPPSPVQPPSNPAIIGLAQNDDLNVATIARQAKQMTEDDDEVVISLH